MATELLKRLALEGVLTDEELHAVLVRRAMFGEKALALKAGKLTLGIRGGEVRGFDLAV